MDLPSSAFEDRRGRSHAAGAAPASVRLLGTHVWTLGLIVLAAIAMGAMLLVRSARVQDGMVAEASQVMFGAMLTLQGEHLATSVRDYTYWDYFQNRFERDHGLRIDHLLLSPRVADRLIASGVDRTPRGWEKASDHTPAWVEIED